MALCEDRNGKRSSVQCAEQVEASHGHTSTTEGKIGLETIFVGFLFQFLLGLEHVTTPCVAGAGPNWKWNQNAHRDIVTQVAHGDN